MRVFIFLLICFIHSYFAVTQDINDSFKADLKEEIRVNDTIFIKKDSIKLYKPIRRHGSLSLMPFDFDAKINKDEFLFNKYQSLTDLIKNAYPVYSLFLGNVGNYNQLSFSGLTPNNISINYNGRNLSSNQFGMLNLDTYSPEFLESIEILTGSKAVIFSNNQFMINLQEIKHNTGKPYTKLWYSQSGYDFLSADGVLSQNIAPNINLTLGFKRISSPGKYDNNWSELWSLRGLLRYNLNENTNFSISHIFINNGFGNSGGLDLNKSINLNDRISSVANLSSSDERLFQHNTNITYSHFFDSLSTISSTIYYANNLNELRLSKDYFIFGEADTNELMKSKDYTFGINFKYNQRINIFNSITILDANYYSISKTIFYNSSDKFLISAGEYLDFSFSNQLNLSGGIRLFLDDKDFKINFGSNLKYIIDYKSFISFDFANSHRKFNLNELKNDFENLITFSGNYSILGDEYNSIINLTYSSTRNHIYFKLNSNAKNILDVSPATIENYQNINLSCLINYKMSSNLNLKLMPIFYYSLTSEFKDLMPIAKLNIDLYYEFRRGPSILQLGLETEGYTSSKSYQFIPFRKIYAIGENLNKPQFDGLSAYINAKFSTAYVKVIFSNILAQPYYTVPYYPSFDRQFKIIINWPFLN